MDSKLKTFGGGNQRGQIILLGDGTEVLTDSDDTEMFDHGDEDNDLESQVHKGEVIGHKSNDALPKIDGLPAKLDTTNPEHQVLPDKFLSNSTAPAEKTTDEAAPHTQTK